MPEELKNSEKISVERSVNIPENPEDLNISKIIEVNNEISQDKNQDSTQATPINQQIQTTAKQLSEDQIFNKKIEQILESDLRDLYINMPKNKQEEFRKKGEQITKQINLLLKDVKVGVKKILNLIFEWLSIIPGVNKVFLKQEAKIKTDKILSLKDKQK